MRQAAGHDLHLDLGTTEEYYGIPVNVVDADQPLLPRTPIRTRATAT
jgi:hypothetical protein